MRRLCLILVLAFSIHPVAHADDRLPIPDKAAQKEADSLVNEVFGKDIESAETSDQKLALTKKLLEEASRSDATPQGRYAVLKVALNVAPDASMAMLVVDEMAKHFQIEILEAKAYTIRQMASTARTSSEHLSVATAGMTLMKGAADQDRYDYAVSLGEIASDAATRAKAFRLLNTIREEAAEVAAEKRLYDRVQVALAQLETDPTNEEANLIVGKYKCFVKGEWADGIPMLALGDDEALKDLATKELMGAKAINEQMALADGWWDVAETSEGRNAENALIHAASFYRRALPSLEGFAKTKVEKRLTTAAVVVYLDDMKELKSSVGVGQLGKHGASGLKNVGSSTAVRGKHYEHMLSAHPPTRGSSLIVYDLNGSYDVFRAKAAILDFQTPVSPLTFFVHGDGKQLWQSRPLKQKGSLQECDVLIRGVQQLTLEIRCPGRNGGAVGVWAEPKVVKNFGLSESK